MRASFGSIVVVAMFSLACGQPGSPTAPTSLTNSGTTDLTNSGTTAVIPGSLTVPLSSKTVPFKGTLEGTVTITPLEPPLANVFIAGTGNATYLGRFTVEIPHLVNFATAIGEGTFTFTAANGDQLTAHFTGAADTSTPIFAIVEHATITGGTGRFANATGTFVARRLYDVAAGTTTGSIEGTISM